MTASTKYYHFHQHHYPAGDDCKRGMALCRPVNNKLLMLQLILIGNARTERTVYVPKAYHNIASFYGSAYLFGTHHQLYGAILTMACVTISLRPAPERGNAIIRKHNTEFIFNTSPTL